MKITFDFSPQEKKTHCKRQLAPGTRKNELGGDESWEVIHGPAGEMPAPREGGGNYRKLMNI